MSELEHEAIEPLLAVNVKSRLTQRQYTQRSCRSGPAHSGAKTHYSFQQGLNLVAIGVLNTTTELDEGIHFLVSRFLGSESFDVSRAARTRSKFKQ